MIKKPDTKDALQENPPSANAPQTKEDAGESLAIPGAMRDISERKKAEGTLNENAELYRTIFEHTATANMIVAEDTTILMVNSNFEALTGYTKSELEHKMSWTMLVAADDLELMKERHRLRRIDPGMAPNIYEFKGVMRSGEVRNLYMSVVMIPGTKNSSVSIIDMTDRMRSEEALRQSEERFRDMVRLLPETVFETDATGKIIFVNETSLDHFGFDSEDVERGLNFLDIVDPQDRERALANFQKIAQGEHLGLSEYLVRKKDGTPFPVLIHTARILKDGILAGSRGFVIDISEKKAMEEQLLRSQKMEAIGTLSGGIAHDFNNLLMGILGNISLMLMEIEETHAFYERFKNMEDYVRRGSDLTRRLLGFARGGKYEVRATNLGKFVLKSAEMFGRTKKDIHIHHKTQDNLWHVDLDRGQMDQVLLNLFVNAWQAMPGGGELYLFLENVTLDKQDALSANVNPGRFVKLTVADTGVGMDAATRARIFEPFFSTKERGHGTGLGLASVYGIIKNHGGFIRVESERGAGTSFVIYLPASSRAVEEETRQDHIIQKGQETILFIDDEEMIVDVGRRMLEGLGYKVLTALGGQAGLNIFELNANRIDLVILDMIMPGLNGKETFEALRRLNPAVKVLLSSGYSLNGPAGEIMASGCRGFIQKPFSAAELSAKVREVLACD
jgi:PAS domain S-box-containing protein